ncbi:sulfur reduction protein DsrS [Sedimenticola hydrogenitrophicus]|uniref:sulfur reduction protein DsrS n=1 Tax=Sedimenticola hydrogenitrophicus TaxID=2967975 RepID=UPI0023B12481|nr:sulfur reduction protein DsrS [Sedimenticola hydrogenitrophicus]
MELSNEDLLRLNVLAIHAEAIRIDENRLEVHGIKGDQEMKVALHPDGNPEHYLRRVRELLAGIVLNSPGGYPVYIQRWTRMGQVESARLSSLLKLAEPEAVMAVVCSPDLTNELARLAWWCEPQAEYARRLLEQPAVAAGPLGAALAAFLVEHLPFETAPQQILESVRLVLQPGLIEAPLKQRLWNRGRSSKSYRVGFLETIPDALPEPLPPRSDLPTHQPVLRQLAKQENRYAAFLEKLLESRGQTFAHTVIDVMTRPADQDVVSALFKAVGEYFSTIRAGRDELREIAEIDAVVESLLATDSGPLRDLWDTLPQLRGEIRAMLFLAHLDDTLLTPILSLTDAVGSVMRKKIRPVSEPMVQNLTCLLGVGTKADYPTDSAALRKNMRRK